MLDAFGLSEAKSPAVNSAVQAVLVRLARPGACRGYPGAVRALRR
ncbi:hypothetical protein SSAG_00803 [Streptomyces sp. Mg1]|nr:hypothetical protein SSAG_00803 [Streptomyces sp. Mg1]